MTADSRDESIPSAEGPEVESPLSAAELRQLRALLRLLRRAGGAANDNAPIKSVAVSKVDPVTYVAQLRRRKGLARGKT